MLIEESKFSKSIHFTLDDLYLFNAELRSEGYYSLDQGEIILLNDFEDNTIAIFRPSENKLYSDYINADGLLDLEHEPSTLDLDSKILKQVKNLIKNTISLQYPFMVKLKNSYQFTTSLPSYSIIDEGFQQHLVTDAVRVIAFNLEIDPSVIKGYIAGSTAVFELPGYLFTETKGKFDSDKLKTFRYKLISECENKSLELYGRTVILHEDVISKIINSLTADVEEIDGAIELLKISSEILELHVHKYSSNDIDLKTCIDSLLNVATERYNLFKLKFIPI